MRWITHGVKVGLLGFVGVEMELPHQQLETMTIQAQGAVTPGRSDSQPALVQRVRDGDRSAEVELVKAYSSAIFLIAMARTRNREMARDLTQETLIAVLKALRAGQVRESNKLAAFIQGTARNIINNHLRAQSRHPECELHESLSVSPVDAFELAVKRRLLRQELQTFSDTDQQILALSLDGHSLAEIANQLNLSHEAVRARKSRMLRKLAKRFEGLSQK